MGPHKPWFSDEGYNKEEYKTDLEKFVAVTGLMDKFFEMIYKELEK
jgi:hypothetical protein